MTPDPSGAARAPQTTDELLAEVKAALQQATPGPWEVFEENYDHDPEVPCGLCGKVAQRRIFTTWIHGQLQGPAPVVTRMTTIHAWRGRPGGEARHGVAIEAADAHLIAKSPEWLGALVQAVEDQQRQLDGLDRSGWVGLLKCCSGPITKGGVRLHFDSCPDKCSAEVTRLRGEVAQLRADGQRLRNALKRNWTPCDGGKCHDCNTVREFLAGDAP